MRIVTPVRFVLQGDIERAKSHMNIARVMLGQMDARSSNPFMNWYRTLDDGTTMRLINNGGQRMAVIDSPITEPVAVSPGVAVSFDVGIGLISGIKAFIYSLDGGSGWEFGGIIEPEFDPIPTNIPVSSGAQHANAFDPVSGVSVSVLNSGNVHLLPNLSSGWTLEGSSGVGVGGHDTDGVIHVGGRSQSGGTFTAAHWAPLNDVANFTLCTITNPTEFFDGNSGVFINIAYDTNAKWLAVTTPGAVCASQDGKEWTMVAARPAGITTVGLGVAFFKGEWYVLNRNFTAGTVQVWQFDTDYNLLGTHEIGTFPAMVAQNLAATDNKMACLIRRSAAIGDPVSVAIYETTNGSDFTVGIDKVFDTEVNPFSPEMRQTIISANGEFLAAFHQRQFGQINFAPWVVRTANGSWEDITDTVLAAFPAQHQVNGPFAQAVRFSF